MIFNISIHRLKNQAKKEGTCQLLENNTDR
jgi:hypothetical protein